LERNFLAGLFTEKWLLKLALVLLGTVGVAWKFFAIDQGQAAAQQTLTIMQSSLAAIQASTGLVDLQEAGEQVMQVVGGVYAPRSSPFEPNVRSVLAQLQLKNLGRAPVRVGKVELHLYRGRLNDEWKQRILRAARVARESGQSMVNPDVPSGVFPIPKPPQATPKAPTKDDTFSILSIDQNVVTWNELVEHKRTFTASGGPIQRGQVRPMNIEFLIADGADPELLKMQVILHPSDKGWTVQEWSSSIGTGPFPDSQATTPFSMCKECAYVTEAPPRGSTPVGPEIKLVPER